MRNDRERMRDIQEAIQKIEKYAIRGKEEFFAFFEIAIRQSLALRDRNLFSQIIQLQLS